ncbi:MAG: homoserine dehydrogenase [Clostridiaceae bacterium]|jgi:homoserine dehydrogenase|nr:homoserine dehydrogenase [Clostridiaceae bacterium]
MKIALLGFGTLGQGIYRILERKREELERYAGQTVEIKKILVRDPQKPRGVPIEGLPLTASFQEILQDESIELVFEVMSSGSKGIEYNARLLEAGKQVISANKAAVAASFFELQETARKSGVHFRFEAAVGGGIPLLDPLGKISRLNEVDRLTGILNASTNYILTETCTGQEENKVLQEARRLGILEEDPADDLEGFDARRKLAILASMLLKQEIDELQIPTIGICRLSAPDFDWAGSQGRQLKLVASLIKQNDTYCLSVLPTALEKDHPMARTAGLMNRVLLEADLTGPLSFHGLGGGMDTVAHALWTDFFEVVHSQPVYFSRQPFAREDGSLDREADFYLRKETDSDGQVTRMSLARALDHDRQGWVVIEKGAP